MISYERSLVYDVSLKEPSEALELSVADTIVGVQYVICNVRYNFHRVAALSNLELYFMSPQAMGQFMEVLSALIDVWVQRHLFCSYVSLNKGCVMLESVKHVLKGEAFVKGAKARSQRKTIFGIEMKSLHHVWAFGMYHIDPRENYWHHMSFTEGVI